MDFYNSKLPFEVLALRFLRYTRSKRDDHNSVRLANYQHESCELNYDSMTRIKQSSQIKNI